MNIHVKPWPAGATESPKLGVALELLGYLIATAAAALCFLMGWLTRNGAAVLTLVLLFSLIGMAWKQFDGGRHPCFFFLCTLSLFQAGRLIAFCAGGVSDTFRISLMTSYQFEVSREVTGTLLLADGTTELCLRHGADLSAVSCPTSIFCSA
jgi:hypothetical protein